VGHKFELKSLRGRGTTAWLYNAAAVSGDTVGNSLRMVIVWDKQPSGNAIPTFDTVFGVTGQDGSETSTYLNPVKYDNMDRFSVLRDCVMDFVPRISQTVGGATNATIERKTFDEFIPLKGREVVFLGQSAPMTIADVSTGAVYVYFRTAEATVNSNAIALEASSFARLRYIDP